jgi:hypothetical protein
MSTPLRGLGAKLPQTDLRHMTAHLRYRARKPKMPFFLRKKDAVKPKDRIKFWNIHPGDVVQVGSDSDRVLAGAS